MEPVKFRNRVYLPVEVEDVQKGDVIAWLNTGIHHSYVHSVAKASVMVKQPKGFKPSTKRVPRNRIKSCWRWHKKVEDSCVPKD